MKRTNSESLFEQAQSLMPGGVNSPVRAFKNVDGKPIFFKSAKGPILIDEDDNETPFSVFISIFHNGKIIISNGNSTSRINQAYAYILDFLCNEENYRRFAVIED